MGTTVVCLHVLKSLFFCIAKLFVLCVVAGICIRSSEDAYKKGWNTCKSYVWTYRSNHILHGDKLFNDGLSVDNDVYYSLYNIVPNVIQIFSF